jgi:hypothetical protein
MTGTEMFSLFTSLVTVGSIVGVSLGYLEAFFGNGR